MLQRSYMVKNRALTRCYGNFKRLISQQGLQDIYWWLQHIHNSPNPIRMGERNSRVTTDASLEGWGAHSENVEASGRWLTHESNNHINVPELRAIFLALQCLNLFPDNHIRIFTDNTTAIAYIRNMGRTRLKPCNAVAKQICE